MHTWAQAHTCVHTCQTGHLVHNPGSLNYRQVTRSGRRGGPAHRMLPRGYLQPRRTGSWECRQTELLGEWFPLRARAGHTCLSMGEAHSQGSEVPGSSCSPSQQDPSAPASKASGVGSRHEGECRAIKVAKRELACYPKTTSPRAVPPDIVISGGRGVVSPLPEGPGLCSR